MAVITVIGSGQMGSALSFPARDNGNRVRLVGTPLDRDIIDSIRQNGWHPTLKRTLPDGCEPFQYEQLAQAVDGADLIISGVSSFGVDWFCNDVLPKLPKNTPVLCVTKGMLDGPNGEMTTYPHHYLQNHPGRCICAVGGPCTSYELADRDHTTVCFCGSGIAALREMRTLLQTSYYHISLSTDVVGVECAVALKNAYALGVSLAVGLSLKQGDVLHYNSQAALFGQSVREMRRLLALVGGSDDNIVHGAGDLYVTVFGGRTRMIGTLLGQGFSYDEAMAQLAGVTLESVVIATRTARAVRALAAAGKAAAGDFPLLFCVDNILNNGGTANDIPWQDFTCETF